MTDKPMLNPLNRGLLVAVAVVTIAGFFLVPLDVSLPIHWNINGEPDNFAPAPLAMLLPALMAAIVIGLLLILRPAGLRRDFAAGRHAIDAAISVVLALALLLGGATIAMGMGVSVDMVRLIAFALGAMLLVLGNYLPKTQPNWIAGLRLPWTMRDPNNWRRTHLWTGRLMMLGGAVALAAALVNPLPPLLFSVVIASVLVPLLAGIAISYAMARRHR